MKYCVIALTLLSILTGCVTTTQIDKPKPKPFVEPIEWSNATPFKDFKTGLFYIDSPETATYLKDMGKFYVSGVSPLQQLDLKGIDVLLFSPLRTCQHTIKGRLEDTVIRYYFLETSSNEIDKKILVYENEFGVKRNVIRSESTAEGIYFANTSIPQDSSSQSIHFLTTKGVAVEGGDIKLIVKRADAEIAGKDAIVRIYFSLDMDSPPIKYTYDSDDALHLLSGAFRVVGESLKSKTEYTLHEAELHGLKILYENNIFFPPPTVVVDGGKPN